VPDPIGVPAKDGEIERCSVTPYRVPVRERRLLERYIQIAQNYVRAQSNGSGLLEPCFLPLLHPPEDRIGVNLCAVRQLAVDIDVLMESKLRAKHPDTKHYRSRPGAERFDVNHYYVLHDYLSISR